MKLIDALNIIAKTAGDSIPFNVALVTGFTPLHLKTFLQAELQQLLPERRIVVNTGLFGDIPGTLTELNKSSLDAAAIVIEWEDLDARLGIRQLGGWDSSVLDDIVAQSQMRLAQFEALIRNLSGTFPITVCLPTLPLPPIFTTASWQASSQELSLREQLGSFSRVLSQNTSVRILSTGGLASLSPTENRLDVRAAWASGFPYQLTHGSALANLLSRLIQNPLAMKGLVTDLDNTLWSGIVGEVGPTGVYWDLDHHSQGHGLYQQFLSELASEGVLVAAASKNELSTVTGVFQRKDILLRTEQVFPLAVSWGSKARAISTILNQWNVGPESIVFVDDDPLEIAEVQEAHPQLTCLRFYPHDPQAIYDLLTRLRDLFGKSSISSEDKLRLESIRASSAFQNELTDADGFSEALLERAQAEVTFTTEKRGEDARALELVNKTNQFNLNGHRLTEADWHSYLVEEGTFFVTVSYADRFGSLGKIAAILGRRSVSTLHIDVWVMSCRAFARRIEYQTLMFIFTKFEVTSISFEYEQTARNGPFSKLVSELFAVPTSTPYVLTREHFFAICPRLFHQVLETTNG
jgi:FkbH-like protein